MESFLIAQKYVPKDVLLQVARNVLLAQDIREESWNGASYNKTNYESAKEAVESTSSDPFWINIISRWINHMWNDVQAWSQDIIAEQEKPVSDFTCECGHDTFTYKDGILVCSECKNQFKTTGVETWMRRLNTENWEHCPAGGYR